MTFVRVYKMANHFRGGLVLAGIALMLASFAPIQANAARVRQAVIVVKGLSCPICAHRLEKVLAKLPGAEKAQVNLQKGQAVVDFAPNAKVTDQEIIHKIRDAGFVPGKVEWRGPQKSS